MTVAEPSPPPVGTGPVPLTHYTGYLLRRAAARSSDCERACFGEQVGLREIALLATLHRSGPTSQRELSDLMYVNRSVMVKLVDGLEDRGWVLRERNQADRRSYALRITAAGVSELSRAETDIERLDQLLTAALDRVERRALTGHLRTLLGSTPVTRVDVLGQTTAYLLSHAHRELRERAVQAFEALGIEPRDFGILTVVRADQPCSRVQVAARLGVTPPAVQSSIDELVDRGLVRLATKSGDRRVHDLELTASGAACLDSAGSAAEEIQSEVVRVLGAEAESELRSLLLKVIA